MIPIDQFRRASDKSSMPITPQQIKEVIESEDDFGFEMRVGYILDTIDFDFTGYHAIEKSPIAHGETYTDSITEVPRQFDFRMNLTRKDSEAYRKRVYFAIECKNLHNSSHIAKMADLSIRLRDS